MNGAKGHQVQLFNQKVQKRENFGFGKFFIGGAPFRSVLNLGSCVATENIPVIVVPKIPNFRRIFIFYCYFFRCENGSSPANNLYTSAERLKYDEFIHFETQ